MYVSSERIATCIAQKLPYADIIGSDTEEQIEANLSRPELIPPPFLFRQPVEIGGENFTIERPVGCFVRGAGTYIRTCKHACVHINKSEMVLHLHNACQNYSTITAIIRIPYIGYLMRVSEECEIAFFTGFAKFSRALISRVHTSVYYSI